MIFELSATLENDILFSMEDQETRRAVDAARGVLVPANSVTIDEENYYALPEWSSSDGYALRQDFTDNLHAPLARAELKRVLVSGRGVFRNFKNVLKSYPEVERKWHFFKDSHLRKRLMDWYNTLRESWGLEKLACQESDRDAETGELVQDDFMFRVYNPVKDRDDITRGAVAIAEEYSTQFPYEVGEALAAMWHRLSTSVAADEKFGFACRTQSEEFAGCILVSRCPSSARKTVALTDFFVLQNFRGLGIGKELLSECYAGLKRQGIQWFLIANTIVPESMEQMLAQWGFKKLGSGFLADLSQE